MPAAVTFNYTGGVQNYVVPAGVTFVDIDARGGAGEGGTGGGGAGGRALGRLAVTPGETLQVYVARAGANAGTSGAVGDNAWGYTMGGAAGGGTNGGGPGGGGGSSAVVRAAVLRILAAGGGGGGGANGYNNGLNAGTAGGAGGGAVGGDGATDSGGGSSYPNYTSSQLRGTGATQSASGSGGAVGGQAGDLSGQGSGGNAGSRGGGGGAGWHGGGGGCIDSGYANTERGHGGGGGSSYIGGAGLTNTSTSSGYQSGNGVVIITPVNDPPTAPGLPSIAPTTVDTNGTISYTAATDPNGDAITYDVELSTNNGGSYAVIVAGTASLAPVYNFSGQPATTTAKLRVRAKDSSGAYGPYATMAGNFTINHNAAPTPATGLTPDGGTVVDRAVVQRLAWTFNDPNAGDTQSKADWRWRLGVGAWTTATVVTPNPYVDVAGGTFPAGSIEWQVLTYDAVGLPATGWSASAFFTAATAPAAPAITSPANNSAQGAPTGLLAWSAPTQDAYQVRKVADNAGVANPAVVYYDTGTLVSTTARDAPLDFPTNNRTEHLQVRIRVAGLWSTWSSVKVNVAWSPPAVPTIVTTARADLAAIDVAVTNPAPVGTQPAVASTELWRRIMGTGSAGERLKLSVVGGTYRDVTPASGVAYEYQAVAIGVTGTKQGSAWTA